MKKLIGTLLCLFTINNIAYADGNFAKLNIRVSGIGNQNKYFLCTDGLGCVSMLAAQKGKVYPLTPGQIQRIFTLDTSNLRTYFQALPESCNVSVDANQTLTVKGKIMKGANDKVFISGLSCSVA